MDHDRRFDPCALIDLVGRRLHAEPGVFVRELLQNSVDAILARRKLDPDHVGAITIEVLDGRVPTLAFFDDGIGLTEEEANRELAGIGPTAGADRDRLGRFGIGLLSAFAVSREIVMVSHSARGENAAAIEWRGRPDGRVSVKPLAHDHAIGTQVYLTCQPGSEPHFTAERVRELAGHFGAMLPVVVRVVAGEESWTVNAGDPPWRRRFASTEEQARALLALGREVFGETFLDAVPLKAKAGSVDGVAFLSASPLPPRHRAFCRGMLLADDDAGLVPEWATFACCVLNSDALEPTAARTTFRESPERTEARESIGRSLRDYLVGLAARDPSRLRKLVAWHGIAIKNLALRDDEFYRLAIDGFLFETSLGVMALGECRERWGKILYVSHAAEFGPIARSAAGAGLGILKASSALDSALLDRLASVVADTEAEEVPQDFLDAGSSDLEPEEREPFRNLLVQAGEALRWFGCEADVRTFRFDEVPAFYFPATATAAAAAPEEPADESEGADDLGSPEPTVKSRAVLAFNANNALVQMLAGLDDRDYLESAIPMLYVQALMLGRHRLGEAETKVMNRGLIHLIAKGAAHRGER